MLLICCPRNEESTTLPRPPQLGVYEPLQSDAVMPLDMTPEEMEHIQHTELAYNVMRDLCLRKRLCIYQAPGGVFIVLDVRNDMLL